jgi:cytochrome c553
MKRSLSVLAALVVATLGASASAQAPATQAQPPSAQDLARGHQLYELCLQCHGTVGQGNRLALAPAIAGLPQWYVESQIQKFRAGHRGGHFDDIAGMRMRPMSLALKSDADVTAVAAYVASLAATKPAPQLEGGDVTRGQALYAPCTACHGPDGAGNQALFGPPLRGASDWYLLTQLSNFKAGVRGTKQGDMSGSLMAPMAATLTDEQAMRDVIAYIQTLK